MGVMPQARNKINDIVESVILGNAEADAALAEGQKSFAPVIEAYNKSIGK
jgi:sn-glycerol 3-phosphate transport system substrate-binding protein